MDKLRFSMVMLAAGMLCAGNVWSAQAGRVQFVNGNVEVTNAAGIKHITQKGDAINEGDTLTSEKTASAQIKMQDGGFIAVRPDSKIKFDSFKFSGKPGEVENSTFSLFRGGFRAITGLIGRLRHQDYRINTPAATIGIRGTDHETVLVLADNPLVKAGLVEAGAYNKVNVGETSITTNRGTINVLPNQMGFAGGLDLAPQIKPINTSLFTVVPQTTPGAKMDSGKSGDSGSRSTASVDTNSQAATENAAPANAAPAAASSSANATTPPAVAPPTVVVNLAGTNSPIPTTPPVTVPPVTVPPVTVPIATAAYVNPNIMFALSSSTAGAVLNQSVGTGAPTAVSPATNPTSFVYNYGNGSNCTTCTTSISYLESLGAAGATALDATTGAQWGYWTGASLTATTTVGTTSTPLPTVSAGNVSWITAPAANPFYLPSVLQGTATYNLVGGVATDGATVTQLSSTGNSATLSVNFTNQTANLLMTVVIGATAPVTWQVIGSSAPLAGIGQGAGQSTFNYSNGTCATGTACGALTFTSAGITTSTLSTASGSLDGNGLTGAIVNFYLNGNNANGLPSSLSGVAALGLSTTTPINAATPWVATLTSFIPPVIAGSTSTTPLIWNGVNGNAVNTALTTIDASGNLSVWQTTSGNNTSLGLTTPGAQTVSFTGATAMDAGTDPVSGIKWGRWAGGTISYTPVAGGTAASFANVDYHWILTPSSNGPIALPVSGTYNYVLAGGTLPTDQAGTTGVVNSASLSANFSAMTVNFATSVSVASTTFTGSGSGVPIQNGTYFEIGNNSGATGNITCSGTCGATTSGSAVGVFTQAGTGAAVSYGFQTGATATPGTPTTMVNGVLAFHR